MPWGQTRAACPHPLQTCPSRLNFATAQPHRAAPLLLRSSSLGHRAPLSHPLPLPLASTPPRYQKPLRPQRAPGPRSLQTMATGGSALRNRRLAHAKGPHLRPFGSMLRKTLTWISLTQTLHDAGTHSPGMMAFFSSRFLFRPTLTRICRSLTHTQRGRKWVPPTSPKPFGKHSRRTTTWVWPRHILLVATAIRCNDPEKDDLADAFKSANAHSCFPPDHLIAHHNSSNSIYQFRVSHTHPSAKAPCFHISHARAYRPSPPLLVSSSVLVVSSHSRVPIRAHCDATFRYQDLSGPTGRVKITACAPCEVLRRRC